MSAIVERLEVRSLRLALRRPFAHSARTRSASRPQLVRLELSDGTVGWGEALPRPYVSGEDGASVRATLGGELARDLLGRPLPDLAAAAAWLGTPAARRVRERSPAAFCGLELALLDVAGRREGRWAGELLGPPARSELTYDGAVVGFMPPAALRLFLGVVKRRRCRLVKVKVGRDDDAERLAAVRRALGDEVRVTIDANGAWSPAEAVARIREFAGFGLAAVEQPVPGRDLAGLARVAAEVDVSVMADESLCALADAERLLELGGVRLWNLRVGKHGGLLAALEIARLAEREGIGCQVGVLVGESGLLEGVGRMLAAVLPSLWHLEGDGSGNRRDDVLAAPLPLATGTVPAPVAAPGLGLEVDPERLDELTEERIVIDRRRVA